MSKKTSTEIWLNPSILDWEAMTSASRPNYAKEWKRAYEIWNHAETRLKTATNDEDRADVISVLRKVLTHRISRLRKIYLDKLSFPGKPAGAIEQLERVGVAKSTMVQNLLAIRNSIEYQDRKAPNNKRCGELLEFVWYFLRSTDPLLASVAEQIEAEKLTKRRGRTPYGFELTYSRETKWRMDIRGDFECADVSMSRIADWIKVVAKKVERKDPRTDAVFKDTDFWIVGYVCPESAQYIKVCQFYFSNPGT